MRAAAILDVGVLAAWPHVSTGAWTPSYCSQRHAAHAAASRIAHRVASNQTIASRAETTTRRLPTRHQFDVQRIVTPTAFVWEPATATLHALVTASPVHTPHTPFSWST